MDLYWILGGWGCGVINAVKCGCSCCCWGGGVCSTLPITFYGSTPRPLGLPSIVWMNGQLCLSQAVFSKLLKRRGSIAEGRIDTSCLCIQLTLWQFSMLVINWVVQMFLSCESYIFAHMQSFVQQVLWVVTSTLFGYFVSLWGSVTTQDVCQLVVTWNWTIPDPSECYSSRTNAFELLVWVLALYILTLIIVRLQECRQRWSSECFFGCCGLSYIYCLIDQSGRTFCTPA